MSQMFDEEIGDSVDQIVTLEVRPRILDHDLSTRYYESSRKEVGGSVCLAAAKRLTEVVHQGDSVVIGTGHVIPAFLPNGETDGPPGAAALAKALTLGLGARVLLTCDLPVVNVMIAACRANGLMVIDSGAAKRIPQSITITDFPIERRAAELRAEEIFSAYNPSAIITVEKIGRNKVGVYHTARGADITDVVAKVDILLSYGRSRGIFTIGIGDLGNEAGLGNIRETVEEYNPFGATCKCPCKSGIATDVKSDIPVTAAVSNWGAYGIVTCLAYLLKDNGLLHDKLSERRMIESCIEQGAVDGPSARPLANVDGIPGGVNESLIEMLNAIINVKPQHIRSFRP